MTSVQKQGYFIYRSLNFKAPINLSSYKFDNRDHKDLLGSNKPKPSKIFARLYEASTFIKPS